MDKEKKPKKLDKKKLEELEKEVKECKKLKDEYLAGWQRTKADFLNYQKQGDKKIETLLNSVKIEWALRMLEIHDFFEKIINPQR
jgi:molecular chaperone GrpE (heat shock protein)